jgi:hypothetical protein
MLKTSLRKFIALGVLGAATLIPMLARADVPFTQQTGSLINVNDTVSLSNLQGESACVLDVTGTWSGVISVEAQVSANNWFSIFVNAVNSTTSLPTVTANGDYIIACPSYRGIRARLSTATSGTALITLDAAQGASPVTQIGPVPLPVTAASPFPVTAASPFPVTAATTLPVSLATTVPVSLANPVTVVASSPLPVATPGAYKYFQMLAQTAATTIVSGPGTFYGMVNASGPNSMTKPTACYDNASAASGTLISETQLANNSELLYQNGLRFTLGLTCLNVGGALSVNGIHILYTNP